MILWLVMKVSKHFFSSHWLFSNDNKIYGFNIKVGINCFRKSFYFLFCSPNRCTTWFIQIYILLWTFVCVYWRFKVTSIAKILCSNEAKQTSQLTLKINKCFLSWTIFTCLLLLLLPFLRFRPVRLGIIEIILFSVFFFLNLI